MSSHTYGLGCFGDGTGVYRPQTTKEPTESLITTGAIKLITKEFPTAFVMKVHGGGYQRAGIPDLYILHQGRSIWIEMKRPGADTTALQRKKLKELEAAGAFCGTAESPERAVQIVKDVLNF